MHSDRTLYRFHFCFVVLFRLGCRSHRTSDWGAQWLISSFGNHSVLFLFRHSKFVIFTEICKVKKIKISLSLTWRADTMCDCTTHWWTTQKGFVIELPFFYWIIGKSMWRPMWNRRRYSLLPWTFIQRSKCWIRQYFESSYMIMLETTLDMVQVTIGNRWEDIHGLSTGIFTFNLGPF